MNEIIANLNYLLTKAKAISLIEDHIPNDLNISINKAICDYNEALKVKNSGSQKAI